MTAPVIRQYPGTIPDKGQTQTAFDTNVDAFLDWQALQFAPDLVAFGVFAQTAANALLAGNLPSLTGQSLKAVRVNAAADGIEMQTVTAAGWALLDDANAAAQRTTLGAAPLESPTFTGVPAAPTAAAATNTTQLATTEFVASAVDALLPIQDAALSTGAATAAGVTWWGRRSAAVAAGAVGSLGFMRMGVEANLVFGTTIAGSSLTPTGANGGDFGGPQSGTWRCLGRTATQFEAQRATLFLRIS